MKSVDDLRKRLAKKGLDLDLLEELVSICQNQWLKDHLPKGCKSDSVSKGWN